MSRRTFGAAGFIASRAAGSPVQRGLAVVLLAVAACTGEDQGRDALPRPGNPAPEYTARTLEGDAVSLTQLRGSVVLLNVWATWCAPCVREMPGLETLHEQYDDQGLRVLGASIDRGSAEREVRRFLDSNNIEFTILLDPDQNVTQRFRTLGVPETFLIGRDGVIAHRWIGEFEPTAPDVIERVEVLLAKEPT